MAIACDIHPGAIPSAAPRPPLRALLPSNGHDNKALTNIDTATLPSMTNNLTVHMYCLESKQSE
eukprot:15240280-Alexandrium_andersonii.AAC.1